MILIAYFDAYSQLCPDAPFLFTANGYLHTQDGQIAVQAVTADFHVSPAVQKLGGRLANVMYEEYKRQVGEMCDMVVGRVDSIPEQA